MSRDPMLQSPHGNETILRPRRTRQRSNFGEVAGGAAAECTAVFCCCPCTLMKLLILAVYKVPAGVCRKAWAMKKKRKLVGKKKEKKQGGLLEKRPNGLGPIGLTREELEMEVKRVKEGTEEEDKINSIVNGNDVETSHSVDLLEEEMWSQFYGTGFFRSPSQRDQ